MTTANLLRDRWVGLFGLWTLQTPGKSLVILGEHHTSPNETTHRAVTESSDHAIYGLMEYLSAAESRDEKVTIYAELSMWNKQNLVNMKKYIDPSTTTFPLKFSLIERFYQELIKGSINETINVNYCNIRHEPPFSLMLMTHISNGFATVYNQSVPLQLQFTTDEKRAAFVKRRISQFEKAFIKNIHNSENTIEFWLSLVLPGTTIPKWYADIVDELYPMYNTSVNSLKYALELLKNTHPSDYNLLIEMYTSVLNEYLKGPKLHTVALAKLQRRVKRYSKATPALIRDQEKIGNYFGTMLTWIQDLYVCTYYINSRNTSKHHLFLVGHGHSRFLSWFLSQKERRQFYGWMTPDPTKLEISTKSQSTTEGAFAFYDIKREIERYIADPSPVSV